MVLFVALLALFAGNGRRFFTAWMECLYCICVFVEVMNAIFEFRKQTEFTHSVIFLN